MKTLQENDMDNIRSHTVQFWSKRRSSPELREGLLGSIGGIVHVQPQPKILKPLPGRLKVLNKIKTIFPKPAGIAILKREL